MSVLKITADEARKLAGIDPVVDDALRQAEHVIREAAKAGRTSVILRGDVFNGGYGPDHKHSATYKWVEHYLSKAGFNPAFHYTKGDVVDDMGMRVSWDKRS